jgi:UDP-glucose 4-epimerase
VPLIVGDTGDQNLMLSYHSHDVDPIIHFAARLVVPDSVKDPLGYYKNNTVNSRALIETAIKERRGPIHLFIDLRGLWQSGASVSR